MILTPYLRNIRRQNVNMLDNKLAIVTGGSRGIGAAIARQLAAQGAAVIVNYARNSDAADTVVAGILAAGGRAAAVQADLADAGAVRRLIAAADTVFDGAFKGRVDILVNNAGMYELATLADSSDGHFDRTMNVNVKAVFIATREAATRMPDGGRIITIGSCLGDRMPFPGGALYAMSKSAVQGLTRGWARDLGPRSITVNCVQPGPIDTDMNPAAGDGADDQIRGTALGRFGKPDDVAALVTFLASPAAANITGAMLTVDGGTNA
jgi:3-oxoacyl-[acyl-carrier protein] reductase